jgi:hypothetical protein
MVPVMPLAACYAGMPAAFAMASGGSTGHAVCLIRSPLARLAFGRRACR